MSTAHSPTVANTQFFQVWKLPQVVLIHSLIVVAVVVAHSLTFALTVSQVSIVQALMESQLSCTTIARELTKATPAAIAAATGPETRPANVAAVATAARPKSFITSPDSDQPFCHILANDHTAAPAPAKAKANSPNVANEVASNPF